MSIIAFLCYKSEVVVQMKSSDWNKAYVSGDTPWDKGSAAPPLNDWLNRNQIGGEVLVLGSGLGHDVRCLAHYASGITAMDISAKAVEMAKSFPLVNRERYLCDDFFNTNSLRDHEFDWIFEHTFFCAIQPELRANYLDRVLQFLKPKGQLLGIFFLETEPSAADSQEGPPYKVSKTFLYEFFTPKFEFLEAYVPTKSYACRPYGSELVLRMQVK